MYELFDVFLETVWNRRDDCRLYASFYMRVETLKIVADVSGGLNVICFMGANIRRSYTGIYVVGV